MDQLLSLCVEENEVNRLERELVAAMVHRITVQWELERILENNDVLYRNEKVGIHSLPVEILVNVLYELLLAPNSGPIGRLMGVCKRWQQVILHTPFLWSIIHIDIPSSLDNLDTCLTYCENSVERSSSVPLDVRLCFPEMKDQHYSTIERKQKEELLQSRDPLLHRLLNRDSLPGFDKRLAAYHARWKEIFYTFVGDKGKVMGRWDSFDCDFFCKECHNPILAFLGRGEFDYSTRTLERLVRDRHSQLSPEVPQSQPYYGYYFPSNEALPALLPSKQFSRLPNIEAMFDGYDIRRATIRDLVYFCKDPDSLRFSLTLHSLTHVQINFCNTERIDTKLGREAIIYPEKELNISRGIARAFWAVFEAPNLESLTLEDLWDNYHLPVPIIINYTFPSLQRIVIHQRWAFFSRRFFDFLHELIRHAPRLTSIQCDNRQEFVRHLVLYRCKIVYLSSSDIRPLGKVVEEGASHSIRTLDIFSLLED
jgi:hypothetical protein